MIYSFCNEDDEQKANDAVVETLNNILDWDVLLHLNNKKKDNHELNYNEKKRRHFCNQGFLHSTNG